MKEIFTKWYSSHDVSGNTERLNNRLEVLKTASKEKDSPKIFDLFNFVLERNIDDTSVSDYFSNKVKEYEGEDFVVSKNELNILSNGTLLYFSQNGEWTERFKTNIILKILSFQKDLPQKLSELVAINSESLGQMSTLARSPRFKSSALKKETDAISQAFQANSNISTQSAVVLKTIQALQTAINDLHTDIAVVREENQLLWWLKSMYLESISRGINELPAANRIICCAYDLRQKSHFYVVPASAAQFIVDAFALENAKASDKVTIKSLIEGIDLETAAKILENFEDELDEYRHFYPLMSALKIAFEYAKEKSQTTTKLPPKSDVSKLSISVVDAAELALSEISLAKLENE